MDTLKNLSQFDQSDQTKIHPQILKHNVRSGDFIMIAPIHKKKIFLVAKVDGCEIYIHPGSRSSQMKILTPGLDQDEWIFRSDIPDEEFMDWSRDPSRLGDGYGLAYKRTKEIKVKWTKQDTSVIKFMSQDSNTSMDYRLIRDIIIENVKVMEQETCGPVRTYKIRSSEDNPNRMFGRENNIRVEAKTDPGAQIVYMNWLDTLNLEVDDEHMWDQMDQYLFNPKNYDKIGDLIDVFNDTFNKSFYALERIYRDLTVISFPGPQTDLIKVVRN